MAYRASVGVVCNCANDLYMYYDQLIKLCNGFLPSSIDISLYWDIELIDLEILLDFRADVIESRAISGCEYYYWL